MPSQGLKILLISPYPAQADKVVGGIQAVTSTLAPALAAHPAVARVSVLAFQQSAGAARRVQVNERLEVWYLPGQRRLRVLTRSFFDVRVARRVAAIMQPDIVHGQEIGWQGDIATQLSPNAVVTVHGLVHLEKRLTARPTPADYLRVRLMDRMVQRVLQRARVVISISHYDAQALHGLIRQHHVQIPNPIAPIFFAPPPPEYAPGRAAHSRRVLFAGVLGPRKNVEGLLEAFALTVRSVPAARLVIVGPAPDLAYAAQIQALVRTLGLTDAVEFVGHVETPRLVQELRACQVVALFSHEETLPTILAQAEAVGKPVIASRVGGVAELIVDGQHGLLVERNDVPGFAERLTTLLRSPELCLRLGHQGAAFAREHFEPGMVVERTLAAYRLAQPSASPELSRERGG